MTIVALTAGTARSVPSGLRLPAPSLPSGSPASALFARNADYKLSGERAGSGACCSTSGTVCRTSLSRPPTQLAAQRHTAADPLAADASSQLNQRDDFGQTALIRAAKDGDINTIKWLLDQGVDVGAQDNWGADALMVASAKGHAAAVELLLRHGAGVQARDCHSRTALHAVALWGAFTVMVNTAILAFPSVSSAQGAAVCAELLVAAGADVNAQDDMGFTPLSRLAQVSSLDEHAAATMRLLLAAGAAGRPALEAALHHENLAALEVLISAGADATALLAAKLEFTQKRGMAADEALLLLRAGASIERLPLGLKQFAVELALRDRAERV